MPATVAAVQTFLGLSPARPMDDDALEGAVVAANDLIPRWRPDLCQMPTWAPVADFAAVLQAAHLYGQRGSTQGVVAYQDVAAPGQMPTIHPAIRALLELGSMQKSVVA